jgi:hypothetical protein
MYLILSLIGKTFVHRENFLIDVILLIASDKVLYLDACHKNFLTKCVLHQEKQTLLHKKHLLLRGSFPINDIPTFIIGWIAEAYDLPYLDNE